MRARVTRTRKKNSTMKITDQNAVLDAAEQVLTEFDADLIYYIGAANAAQTVANIYNNYDQLPVLSQHYKGKKFLREVTIITTPLLVSVITKKGRYILNLGENYVFYNSLADDLFSIISHIQLCCTMIN